jgi:hypothetical protein
MLTPQSNVTPRKRQERGTQCLSLWCQVDVDGASCAATWGAWADRVSKSKCGARRSCSEQKRPNGLAKGGCGVEGAHAWVRGSSISKEQMQVN